MGEQKRKGKKKGAGPRKSKSALTTIIVVVCIIIIGVVDFVSRSNNSPLMQFDPARTQGNSEAPFRILEFVDFQCSECARGSKLIKKFMTKHPGKIYLSMKYYPLGELNSMISALYGECAAQQNKFWLMHDYLFDRQDQWRTLKKPEAYLNVIAQDAQLDMNQLGICLDQNDVRSTVHNEHMLGEAHFVKSTPTYFVNDEIIVGVEVLRGELEEFFGKDYGEYLR